MAEKEFSTALSTWTNTITSLVTKDFDKCGVPFDDYSKNCAMAAMTNIYQLITSQDAELLSKIDTSNLRDVVGQCASLKLNANAYPRECFFSLRSKQIGGSWVKVVEMMPEGDGYDSMLRNFGEGVERVFPVWIVKEKDEFTYPRHRGVEVEPPEWNPIGNGGKAVRVVYPVKLTDGSVQYLITEREDVRVNLFAHVRNNLMRETFGICDKLNKATEKQKAEIAAKKREIYDALAECETVDDMLKCEIARPYISAAWTETPEAMIIRKMRNNAIRKFPKNYNSIANRSLAQIDETLYKAEEEIEEESNAEEFVVDAEAVEV